jgi:hypothetical protein
MRAAARQVTQPAPRPTGRKRQKGGAGGKAITRSTAREIAEDYLKLCQNPARDVLRWLAEDRKRPAGNTRRITITTRAGRDYAASRREGFVSSAHGLCRQPLPAMRDGLDPHRHGGRRSDNLPSGPRASAGEYGGLRPLRAEGEGQLIRRSGTGGDLAGRFGAMMEGISAEFRRKLAALGAKMMPWERAAAVRALKDERDASMRALRERRAVQRQGERMAATPK